jgi:hypothetical protein
MPNSPRIFASFPASTPQLLLFLFLSRNAPRPSSNTTNPYLSESVYLNLTYLVLPNDHGEPVSGRLGLAQM